MAKKSKLAKIIHQQFLDYYGEFSEIADRAPAMFTAGDLDGRLKDDLLRVQLYRTAIDRSATSVQRLLGKHAYDLKKWNCVRKEFKKEYADELATTYFTSVMRKVFAEKSVSIEFRNDGIKHTQVNPDRIVHHHPLKTPADLGRAIHAVLGASDFSASLSENISQNTGVIVDIVNEQLEEADGLLAMEALRPTFFRGKGAYLVGQFRTRSELIPVIFCIVHSPEGVNVDAVLVGYHATRSFLFSSTRSAFTVSTKHYRELYSFLQRLFPNENPANILDLIGFTHPAKLSLLRQLREILHTGEKYHYVGTGPVDLVFGLAGFPLVFKVLRRDLADRDNVIGNFVRVHTIDRLGQVLDSLDYKDLKFRRDHFSAELLEVLADEQPEDVRMTSRHVILKQIYVSRRIKPVSEYIRTASKKNVEQVLRDVGWNIKHLAAMGFVPRSLGLEHFGFTTWDRVVYLNNASLLDIQLFNFRDRPDTMLGAERYNINPADFEKELNIPQQHRDMFRAVHGDLYLPDFWEDRKISIHNGRYPDVFPYQSRYRVESRKFRYAVVDELQRISGTADADRIHIVLDNIAVVDVELAGLSFLRLEVPYPSARVLVLEPIGPEIIAQLHRQFQDVTFDILQSESEVVESAGQWIPGIHGKLMALVQVRKYDYVIGYVNETFDEEFFQRAKLRGFLLLSTGTHNIDIKAATSVHTVVTNAPGPTTTTVAEQNVGSMLDAVYAHAVRFGHGPEGFVGLRSLAEASAPALAIAQVMWLSLLLRTLKLDEMFAFGASRRYVRTGVGERATVYHDQIGQNREAGISRSIGVIGLKGPGIHLVEFAIAYEISTVYVLEEEYGRLSADDKEGLQETIAIIKEIAQVEGLSIKIAPVDRNQLLERSAYVFNAEPNEAIGFEREKNDEGIDIDIGDIFVRDLVDLYTGSLSNLTLGIQGLGRIGEAVAQRSLVLGLNILIFQRDPGRPTYRAKRRNLLKLADHCSRWAERALTVEYAEDKDAFFRKSNIITTLAATTSSTLGWVDQRGLDQFAAEASGPVRVIVSAGKGLVDEDALIRFLKDNPAAEARLDVLSGEHEGGAYLKLVDDRGSPLRNIKVTGHTAAAVREVRQLKVYKALDNLRKLIDGKIPPNIVNNPISKGKTKGTHSTIEREGLSFFRMEVPSPKARVLVIEPLPPEILLQLQQQFGDVSFDILLAESELVEVDGRWSPGINAKLNEIVASREYDYCLGYCNASFDAPFFEQGGLKGLILFATAIHHIDLAAATQAGTVVTNSPGFTTVAVTEQNIAMALDAFYGRYIQDYLSEGAVPLHRVDIAKEERARTVAQIMWFMLLKGALKLDAMYQFGSGDKYVRTGVRRDATIYHDQLGQNDQAGIKNSIGIIGLDEVGLNIVELAMAHELSVIYVLEDEYEHLSRQQKSRLEEVAEIVAEVSQTKAFSMQLIPVNREDLVSKSTYTIKTPAAYETASLAEIKAKSAISVHADRVYVNNLAVFERSLVGATFGVQGLGRIGEAVVQRALAFGCDVIVCQRDPERPEYQEKQERLRHLARNRAWVYRQKIDTEYVDKATLFRKSNIVTTLAATTSGTRYWVDREALDMLGCDAQGPVRILVNAGKGLLNEAALAPFLRERPEVEVRLDVLSDEQEGKAGQRFLDADGRSLANLKIAGHTAAAVPELRRLKVFNALNNLRLHIDGYRPNNVLNRDVVAEN